MVECTRRNPLFLRVSFDDFAFESHAFLVVVPEPSFRSVGIGEGLDVIGMADVISGVDIDPDFHLNASAVCRSRPVLQARPAPSQEKLFRQTNRSI